MTDLAIRCAAQGIVLNGLGSQIRQPIVPQTIRMMNVRMSFVQRGPTLAKIDSIKALRWADPTLGLKEAKDFVEGITLVGTFESYETLNEYLAKVNAELDKYGYTGRITIVSIQEHLVRI